MRLFIRDSIGSGGSNDPPLFCICVIMAITCILQEKLPEIVFDREKAACIFTGIHIPCHPKIGTPVPEWWNW